MKKITIVMLSLLLVTITGCSKTSDLIYGEYLGNKYINESYKFSMEIPESWEVNEDIKRVNETNEILHDIEELIIALMYPSTNDRSNGLTVVALNRDDGIEGYINEMSESNLLKNVSNENINGKEFTVLQYENGFIHLTESSDRIIEFNSVYSNDIKKDEIKTAIESVKFK